MRLTAVPNFMMAVLSGTSLYLGVKYYTVCVFKVSCYILTIAYTPEPMLAINEIRGMVLGSAFLYV